MVSGAAREIEQPEQSKSESAQQSQSLIESKSYAPVQSARGAGVVSGAATEWSVQPMMQSKVVQSMLE